MAATPPAPPPGRAEPAGARRKEEGRKEGSRAAAPGAGQLPRRKEPAGAFRNLHEASGDGESGQAAAQALLRGGGTAERLGPVAVGQCSASGELLALFINFLFLKIPSSFFNFLTCEFDLKSVLVCMYCVAVSSALKHRYQRQKPTMENTRYVL